MHSQKRKNENVNSINTKEILKHWYLFILQTHDVLFGTYQNFKFSDNREQNVMQQTRNFFAFQSQPHPYLNVIKCCDFMFSMQTQATLHLISYCSILIWGRVVTLKIIT